MSTNSQGIGGGGGFAPGPLGTRSQGAGMTPGFTPFGEEDAGPSVGPSGVAGATTLTVLLVSIIAMGLGADAQRILLTATIALSIYALLNISAGPGIVLAVTYMSVLGGLRRYSLPFLGYASYDPYLVVGPVVVTLFFIGKLARRDIPRDTPIAKAVLVFLVLMFLEIFNPLQGGILVGFGGALFSIVPVLWYYCGRNIGSYHAASVLMRVMVWVAVMQGCYGLYQQFFGFSDTERQWMALTHTDGGLYLGGSIMRVFALFVSFAEYVHFTSAACVVAFALAIRGQRQMFFPCAFLFFCVFMSSSRGGLLGTVAGFALIWAIMAKDQKMWIPRLLIGVAIGLVSLQAGLSNVKTETLDTTSATIIAHQQRGILSPDQSNGGDHVGLLGSGMLKGITNPLGSGLGAAGLGGSKFGGTNGLGSNSGAGSESDLGDVFIACGFIGGVLFIFIVGRAIWMVANMYHKTRHVVFLAAFAFFTVRLGSWLMTSEYSTIMMLWFCLGIMDQLFIRERARVQQIAANGAAAAAQNPATGRPFMARR